MVVLTGLPGVANSPDRLDDAGTSEGEQNANKTETQLRLLRNVMAGNATSEKLAGFLNDSPRLQNGTVVGGNGATGGGEQNEWRDPSRQAYGGVPSGSALSPGPALMAAKMVAAGMLPKHPIAHHTHLQRQPQQFSPQWQMQQQQMNNQQFTPESHGSPPQLRASALSPIMAPSASGMRDPLAQKSPGPQYSLEPKPNNRDDQWQRPARSPSPSRSQNQGHVTTDGGNTNGYNVGDGFGNSDQNQVHMQGYEQRVVPIRPSPPDSLNPSLGSPNEHMQGYEQRVVPIRPSPPNSLNPSLGSPNENTGSRNNSSGNPSLTTSPFVMPMMGTVTRPINAAASEATSNVGASGPALAVPQPSREWLSQSQPETLGPGQLSGPGISEPAQVVGLVHGYDEEPIVLKTVAMSPGPGRMAARMGITELHIAHSEGSAPPTPAAGPQPLLQAAQQQHHQGTPSPSGHGVDGDVSALMAPSSSFNGAPSSDLSPQKLTPLQMLQIQQMQQMQYQLQQLQLNLQQQQQLAPPAQQQQIQMEEAMRLAKDRELSAELALLQGRMKAHAAEGAVLQQRVNAQADELLRLQQLAFYEATNVKQLLDNSHNLMQAALTGGGPLGHYVPGDPAAPREPRSILNSSTMNMINGSVDTSPTTLLQQRKQQQQHGKPVPIFGGMMTGGVPVPHGLAASQSSVDSGLGHDGEHSLSASGSPPTIRLNMSPNLSPGTLGSFQSHQQHQQLRGSPAAALDRFTIAGHAGDSDVAAALAGDDECTYTVTVVTGDKVGAGTDANVHIEIIGSRGTSKIQALMKSQHRNKFERNQSDTFQVKSRFLGKLKSVVIGHDGKGLGADWYLDRVTVKESEADANQGQAPEGKQRQETVFFAKAWMKEFENVVLDATEMHSPTPGPRGTKPPMVKMLSIRFGDSFVGLDGSVRSPTDGGSDDGQSISDDLNSAVAADNSDTYVDDGHLPHGSHDAGLIVAKWLTPADHGDDAGSGGASGAGSTGSIGSPNALKRGNSNVHSKLGKSGQRHGHGGKGLRPPMEYIVVVGVSEAAESSGVRVGDLLLAVANMPRRLGMLSVSSARKKMRGAEHSETRVRVMRPKMAPQWVTLSRTSKFLDLHHIEEAALVKVTTGKLSRPQAASSSGKLKRMVSAASLKSKAPHDRFLTISKTGELHLWSQHPGTLPLQSTDAKHQNIVAQAQKLHLDLFNGPGGTTLAQSASNGASTSTSPGSSRAMVKLITDEEIVSQANGPSFAIEWQRETATLRFQPGATALCTKMATTIQKWIQIGSAVALADVASQMSEAKTKDAQDQAQRASEKAHKKAVEKARHHHEEVHSQFSGTVDDGVGLPRGLTASIAGSELDYDYVLKNSPRDEPTVAQMTYCAGCGGRGVGLVTGSSMMCNHCQIFGESLSKGDGGHGHGGPTPPSRSGSRVGFTDLIVDVSSPQTTAASKNGGPGDKSRNPKQLSIRVENPNSNVVRQVTPLTTTTPSLAGHNESSRLKGALGHGTEAATARSDILGTMFQNSVSGVTLRRGKSAAAGLDASQLRRSKSPTGQVVSDSEAETSASDLDHPTAASLLRRRVMALQKGGSNRMQSHARIYAGKSSSDESEQARSMLQDMKKNPSFMWPTEKSGMAVGVNAGDVNRAGHQMNFKTFSSIREASQHQQQEFEEAIRSPTAANAELNTMMSPGERYKKFQQWQTEKEAKRRRDEKITKNQLDHGHSKQAQDLYKGSFLSPKQDQGYKDVAPKFIGKEVMGRRRNPHRK